MEQTDVPQENNINCLWKIICKRKIYNIEIYLFVLNLFMVGFYLELGLISHELYSFGAGIQSLYEMNLINCYITHNYLVCVLITLLSSQGF